MATMTIPDELRIPQVLLRRSEAVAGVFVFKMWFLLYAAGSLIGTGSARERIMGEAPLLEKACLGVLILLCYTSTNVAILCSLASILGGLFRRGKERSRGKAVDPSLLILLFSLALQGFVIYLVIISGVVSFSGKNPLLISPDQNQYMRLAATASLFSFMIGYSPGALNGLLSRLERMIGEGPEPAPREEPEAVA